MKYLILKYSIPAHIVPILIILLVTVSYTWPLLSRLTVAIPGRFELTDTTETIWSIGWVYQALSRGENVWYTDRLFVPYGADLRFNVFGLLQGLLAFPLVPLLGGVGASNFVIIITMFLNGISAYFLVSDHIKHTFASLLASVCHMLSLAVVWHFSAGRNALPALWIVSISLLCLKILLDNPSIWKGLLLGCSLIAALLTDLHVTIFTCMWGSFYVVAYYWKNGFRKSFFKLFTSFLIAISMFVSAFCFVLIPSLPSLSGDGFPVPSLDDTASYAFSIKDFVDPQQIPFIYGFDFLLSTVLAVFLFRWQGDYRFWLFGSLIFLVLSLGPYLKPTHIPLPYSLVSVWTPLRNFRTPYRFVIPATIGLTLVMGYVLASLLTKVPARGVAILVGGVIIALQLWYTIRVQPFETQVYPSYAFYQQISNESGDFAVIEVPFGVRSGLDQIGQGGERVQYYQHIHGKRILNGSLARLPTTLFSFYRSHPSLIFFSGDMSVDRSRLSDDFSNVLGWAEARYVLVHRSLMPVEHSQQIESFLDQQPQLQRIGLENDLVIYRVIP